jgi:hypothetical protein
MSGTIRRNFSVKTTTAWTVCRSCQPFVEDSCAIHFGIELAAQICCPCSNSPLADSHPRIVKCNRTHNVRSNLNNWFPLKTPAIISNGFWFFSDTNAGAFPQRFYRAFWPEAIW